MASKRWRTLADIFYNGRRWYPYTVEYWETEADIIADDNHKRSKSLVVMARNSRMAEKEFKRLHSGKVAYTIVHEPILN